MDSWAQIPDKLPQLTSFHAVLFPRPQQRTSLERGCWGAGPSGPHVSAAPHWPWWQLLHGSGTPAPVIWQGAVKISAGKGTVQSDKTVEAPPRFLQSRGNGLESPSSGQTGAPLHWRYPPTLVAPPGDIEEHPQVSSHARRGEKGLAVMRVNET